jgi:hypothetical protein
MTQCTPHVSPEAHAAHFKMQPNVNRPGSYGLGVQSLYGIIGMGGIGTIRIPLLSVGITDTIV